MRRFVRELFVCLVGGVVLTVVVSWGTVLLPHDRTIFGELDLRVRWRVSEARDWPAPVETFRQTDGPARQRRFFVAPYRLNEGVHATVWNDFGWPFHAFSRADVSNGAFDLEPVRGWRGGIRVPGLREDARRMLFGPRRRIPLVPLWPGFAIDTLFYAGVSWPLLFGPFALRRAVRRRRGRCPYCGYDLAGLAGCPECGAS